MPLIKSKSKPAFVSNLKAELAAGKPRAQSLAIAYSMKRLARATGGAVHEGPIISSVPGRTDDHPMDVAAGSYVIPAHVISGLGQGNTLAGMDHLHKMFPDKHMARRAFGGKTLGQAVPINAAGGEFVVTPEQIIAKYGSLEKGHKALDSFCKTYTKKLVKQISKLPGPAQD